MKNFVNKEIFLEKQNENDFAFLSDKIDTSEKKNYLLILGNRYHFSKLEYQYLNEKYQIINIQEYKIENSIQKIIAKIELLEKEKKLLIINNIETISSPVDSLSKYLSQKKNYSTIEQFLEHHLQKISPDLVDITQLTLNKANPISKTLIDYTLAMGLLLVASPLILYSIYRIKKESSGSVLFKQNRVGENGKVFTCYKFRSMYENSYEDFYTRKNDLRVFPWGKVMREMRIDELPQILNVLKGEMHLIGPRAEWDILANRYANEIPNYHIRHLVKPGITGWAQVNYPYGENIEDTKQKLMYDLYYIKNWSLMLEIKTIFKTIAVVLRKQGV